MTFRRFFVATYVSIVCAAAVSARLPAAEAPDSGSGTPPRTASSAQDPQKAAVLLRRLKSEYQKSGDDFDRKAQLIDWAEGNGVTAMATLRPLVQREGEARLAAYGEAFSRCIDTAPECKRAGVLAAQPELKTQRDHLIRFSAMAAKLTQQETKGHQQGHPAAAANGLEKFLASREEAMLQTWKVRMGFAGLDDEEIVVVRETNRMRKERGLRPLTVDPALCRAAREHSRDMVEHGFFSHESPLPGKRTIVDRARRFGTDCASENIARSGEQGKDALESWLTSGGHRENMLRNEWRRIGVGRHEDHFTQTFGR